MKTFEERYTAWIDGKLSGPELEAFERELEEHPEAADDKSGVLKLGALLRSHGQAPVLANADFFNHQLLGRIAAEADRSSEPVAEPVRRPLLAWLFRPFAWATAACLIVAGYSAYRLLDPHHPVQKDEIANYVQLSPTPIPSEPEAPNSTQIVSAESTDPDISVTPIHSEKDNVTVLWVDGLDYIPASYHIP